MSTDNYTGLLVKWLWNLVRKTLSIVNSSFVPSSNLYWRTKNLQRLYSTFYPLLLVYQHQKQLLKGEGHPLTTFLKVNSNTKEGLELENIGAVDKLAFKRLNGPPPGLSVDRRIYKSALALMFKGDYASHFLHIGRNVKAALIVVNFLN